MEKTYNPQDIEQPLYEHWEKQGYFKPNGDESQESFCIMIPPPNVTGSLHMGHAFQQTIMDTMIRYQRMQGKNTLWQVGTDHAGIATQMVVERKIAAEEGKTRHDYGREAFIDKIWEWKAESGGTITRQMRRLGNSVDWERERFTMDEGLSNAVKEVFVRLYKEDLIYRGKRLVNWDPKLRTAISDLEVENRESKGSMWHIRYPLADGAKTADGKDYLVVATTRPETLLGDTGVAVNPEDPRYKDLIGKYVILPLVNRRIPIVGDEHADMEKGTGCVKITPAHDFNDYEVGKRHALPMINILTFDGDIRESAQVFDTKGNESDVYSSEIPAEFQKLERFAARKAVVAAVDALGLLEEIKPHDLTVPYGDRGGVIHNSYRAVDCCVHVLSSNELFGRGRRENSAHTNFHEVGVLAVVVHVLLQEFLVRDLDRSGVDVVMQPAVALFVESVEKGALGSCRVSENAPNDLRILVGQGSFGHLVDFLSDHGCFVEQNEDSFALIVQTLECIRIAFVPGNSVDSPGVLMTLLERIDRFGRDLEPVLENADRMPFMELGPRLG